MTERFLALAPAVVIAASFTFTYLGEWVVGMILALVATGLGYWFRLVHVRTEAVPGLVKDVKKLEEAVDAMRQSFVEHLDSDRDAFGEVIRRLDGIDRKL